MEIPTLKSLLWMILRIGIGVYFGLCLLLYLRQSAMVFHPTREITLTPGEAGMAYEDFVCFAEDGARITGWLVPAPDPRGTILVLHGNGGNISHRMHLIGLLRSLGWEVCIIDYRGYGASSGRPTEAGTYLDARAAWHYLVRERGVPPERIVVHGRSLGGAIATELATAVQPAGLILESTFLSVPEMGRELYPFLPVRGLSRFRYDTLSRLPRVRCPILIAHSAQDEMIPFRHGERLFAAAPEPKTFFTLSGGHNDGEDFTEPAYRAALVRFLDSCVPPPVAPALVPVAPAESGKEEG